MDYATLASYAVVKSLTDNNKYRNSYEILAEFIRFIIIDRKFHKFSLMDIYKNLQIEYGFNNIPLPVVRTSMKQISECKKEGDEYILTNVTSFKQDVFEKAKQASSKNAKTIIHDLLYFAKNKYAYNDEDKLLENAFIKYLLDDTTSINQRYLDIISKYILSIDENNNIKNEISNIREGSILFYGLAYNVNEIGSLTSDITLYLDTEVLFNIAGYNGTLYQIIANDFLEQIKIANKKVQRIRLKYFEEIENEVKAFFCSAERSLEGRGEYVESTAMKAILNGCNTISDIRDKEADFFYNLKNVYGINVDDKSSFYKESDYQYNIEDIPNGYANDEKTYEAVRFISHINVLRKGERFTEYTKSRYLFITETRRIQELSNVMKEDANVCGFALPMSTITNILWFKLGNGFSKSAYPINADVSYKAKFILSGELARKVAKLYDDTKLLYKEGQLDREKVASRIVLMREKSKSPDEISYDNIDDVFDFSNEFISQFEEGVKYHAAKDEEKRKLIEKLKESLDFNKVENERLQEKVRAITKNVDSYKLENQERKRIINEQNNELIKYKEEFLKLRREKEEERIKIKYLKQAGIKILMFVAALGMFFIFFSRLSNEYRDIINAVVGSISFVSFLYSMYKNEWKEYKDSIINVKMPDSKIDEHIELSKK